MFTLKKLRHITEHNIKFTPSHTGRPSETRTLNSPYRNVSNTMLLLIQNGTGFNF